MSTRFFPILIAIACSFGAANFSSAAETNFVPSTFAVYVGGFEGGYRVQLTNGVLHYEKIRGVNVVQSQISPTPEQWRKFRQDLDRLKVWNWKADYPNSGIQDGTQWDLQIKYADRTLAAKGDNNYPGKSGKPNRSPKSTETFESFLKSVQALLGGKEFQ